MPPPSGSRAPGKAPAIHLPWNKARVQPLDDGGGRRGGERKRGGGVGAFENGDAGASDRGGRGGGSGGKSARNGGSRNGGRGERRGPLPGLMSADLYRSLDGGGFINGSYFSEPVATGGPPQAKRTLSEALDLTPGHRRLRGGGEGASSRDQGPVGGGGVSGGAPRAAGRRAGESEVWWTTGKPRPGSDSETGSRASSSEFRASLESSTNSSATSGPDETESGSETEKQDWETVEEEEEEEGDSGLEGEARGPEESQHFAGGNSVSSDGGNSSTKLSQEGSRPPRSAQAAKEEEAEQDEEVRNVLSLILAGQTSASDGAKDLSPIMEDREEEEEEDKGEEEETGDMGGGRAG